LNNIYGVDIDPQAVEVTKLSLLLKVLEGESEETLGKNLRLFHERALPDLGENIRCGNSLIGPDFYDSEQLSLIDPEERYQINAFDWRVEFPEIMGAGGFDAVVGNPPYIRVSVVPEVLRPYLYKAYDIAHRFDIYVAFVEKGFDLLNDSGLMGFILPNKFMTSEYGEPLRARLAEQAAVSRVVDFQDHQVFRGATTYTCLLFLSKTPSMKVDYLEASGSPEASEVSVARRISVASSDLSKEPWCFLDRVSAELLKKLRALPTLGDLCHIQRGLETGADAVFLLRRTGDLYTSTAEKPPFALERGAVRHVVKGAADLSRYHIKDSERFVLFPYRGQGENSQPLREAELKAEYPKAWAYLCRHALALKGRSGSRPVKWCIDDDTSHHRSLCQLSYQLLFP